MSVEDSGSDQNVDSGAQTAREGEGAADSDEPEEQMRSECEEQMLSGRNVNDIPVDERLKWDEDGADDTADSLPVDDGGDHVPVVGGSERGNTLLEGSSEEDCLIPGDKWLNRTSFRCVRRQQLQGSLRS